MSVKVRSVLDGFPKTIDGKTKDGQEKLTVMPTAIVPRMAKISDITAKIVCGLSVPATIYEAFLIQLNEPWHYFGLLGLPVAAYLGTKWYLRHLFTFTKRFEFTPELFIVRRVLLSNIVVDRSLPGKFTLYIHNAAQEEKENIENKKANRVKRWWNLPIRVYYGNSYHLAYEYMGQRIDIMTIFGSKKANLILSRLNNCNRIMDGYASKGQGQALRPEDEWDGQSGQLNDTF